MITARNYAAQAERDLRKSAKSLRSHGMILDAVAVELHADILRDSIKFVIPDGGTIFDDNLRGLRGVEFRLPYNSIAIEYFIPDGGSDSSTETPFGMGDASILVKKRIAMAYIMGFPLLEFGAGKPIKEILDPGFWENGEDSCVSIQYLDFSEELRMWMLGSSQCLIPISAHIGVDAQKYKASVIPLLPETWALIVQSCGVRQAMANACQDVNSQVRVVFELCEALSCTNVDTAIHQHSTPWLNAKRIKAGKLPIYETKVLTIKSNHVTGESRGPLGHERNGPRQHLRRGHIRRLPSGKNTWVQSCVVGSLANGLIQKSYEVTA